jgi:hypothetical protein
MSKADFSIGICENERFAPITKSEKYVPGRPPLKMEYQKADIYLRRVRQCSFIWVGPYVHPTEGESCNWNTTAANRIYFGGQPHYD